MGLFDRYQRSREFFANANRAIESAKALNQELFLKIKAMTEADVEGYLNTLKQSQRANARATIMFIKDSDDLETCRQALLIAGFIS